MAAPTDTTDPGNVNVELQAFGVGLPANVTPGSVVATSWPAMASPTTVQGANNSAPQGLPVNVNIG